MVPLGEEAPFRGFLLTVLAAGFRRHTGTVAADRCAVAVGAVAFGVGHLGNAAVVPSDFLLVQVGVATAFGLVAGLVRVRTNSLVGPVTLHAAMNAAATV